MLAGYKARYYLLANSDFPLFKAATEKMWDRPATLARRTSDTLAVAYECLHEEQQDDDEARPEFRVQWRRDIQFVANPPEI